MLHLTPDMLIREHGWTDEDFRKLAAYYTLRNLELCPDCMRKSKLQDKVVECRACGAWYQKEG